MTNITPRVRDRRVSRSRWAAIGAAVAITSGVAGVAKITLTPAT